MTIAPELADAIHKLEKRVDTLEKMTPAKQLKQIEGILNIALAPTLKFEGKGRKMTEMPMTQAERVQWVVDELRDKNNELDAIAEEAAGEDL